MRALSLLIFLICSNSLADQLGHNLLSACDKPGSYCLGYVAGVIDAQRPAHGKRTTYCLPEGGTYGQLELVVVKYLRDHPENLHYTAASLVEYALQTAFPCK